MAAGKDTTQKKIDQRASSNDTQHLEDRMNGFPNSNMRMLGLLRALNAAAATIQKSVISEEEIYETFGEQVRALGMRGGLAILDPTGDSVTIRAVSMPPKVLKTLSHFEKLFKIRILGYSVPIHQVEAYNRVIQTLQPLYLPDSSETITQLLPLFARPFGKRIVKAFGNVAVVYAPLIRDTQVIGILNISGPDLSETDVPAIQAFANHIAIALINQQLFRKAQEELDERRQVEQALRISEQRYRSLVENFPNGTVAIFDENLRLTFADGVEVRELGVNVPESIGKHFSEMGPAEMGEIARPHLAKAFEGQPSSFETPYWEGKHYIFSVAPLYQPDGQIREIYIVTQNITSRKQTEHALRESEARYRQLFESNPHPMWVYDLETLYFLAVNDAAVLHYGYSRDEFFAMTIKDIRPPEDVSRLLGNIAQVTDGLDEAGIWRHIKKNGEVILVEITSHILTFDSHRAEVVLAHDVTERMKAEQEMKESEARYRALMQNSLEAIYVYDTKLLRVVDVNTAFLKLLGYSEEEVHDLTLYDIVAQDRASIDAFMEKILSEGAIFMGERFWRHKDGSTILMEATGSRFHQAGKDLVFVIGRDISERKLAEEKIRRQINYLSALREVDQIIASTFDDQISLKALVSRASSLLAIDAVTILLLDSVTNTFRMAAGQGFRTHKIYSSSVKFNESYAGRAILERQMIQIRDLKTEPETRFHTVFIKDEGFVCYYGVPLIAKGKAIGVMEVFHRTPVDHDQEWIDFLTTLAGQAAIAIDNALLFEHLQRSNLELERRVYERTAQLNKVNVELEQANRAKDEFLANMSHELRTPLNSIMGLSETLLEQRRDPLSQHQQKSLQIIESSGRHLLDLINDILDLSKIEAGMFDVFPQVVDVESLCRSSRLFIKSQAMRKSITVVYEKDQSITEIFADPRRLKQILVNLLTNAVKFTPEHGHVTLQVNADAENDRVQFSVTDSGIGIADADLKRLFQPFVQLDGKLNRQQEGTGLGLALVQKLTDLHGGSVQVESGVGRGSRFTINLPWGRQFIEEHITAEPETALVVRERSTESLGEAGTRRSILLAEDNMPNILTIGEYLKSHKYKIVVAHDGWEAIELAEKINPDLILMDIQMPSLDGLEATRRLRRDPRFASTPIIALTALAMPGDRQRCLEAGANEYLSKPVSLKRLASTISELLGR